MQPVAVSHGHDSKGWGVAVLLPLAFLLPLAVLLPIGVLELQPFFGWLQPALFSNGEEFQALGLGASAWGLAVVGAAFFILPLAGLGVSVAGLLRRMRAGENVLADRAALAVAGLLLAVSLLVWGNLVLDQLPCWLGVPNCD